MQCQENRNGDNPHACVCDGCSSSGVIKETSFQKQSNQVTTKFPNLGVLDRFVSPVDLVQKNTSLPSQTLPSPSTGNFDFSVEMKNRVYLNNILTRKWVIKEFCSQLPRMRTLLKGTCKQTCLCQLQANILIGSHYSMVQRKHWWSKRKGRTGCACVGHVFGWFHGICLISFDKYEKPAM